MTQFIDLTGQKFGRLTVVASVGMSKRRNMIWLCRCDCGKKIEVKRPYQLKNGHTLSCGCLKKEQDRINFYNVTHGMSGTPEHRAWKNMRRRCLSPGNKNYPEWGGRGITICSQWDDFSVFFAYIGAKPTDGLYELDRKDPNGNYEPGNVRWWPKGKGNRRPKRRRGSV
jgi:hypothetical protein